MTHCPTEESSSSWEKAFEGVIPNNKEYWEYVFLSLSTILGEVAGVVVFWSDSEARVWGILWGMLGPEVLLFLRQLENRTHHNTCGNNTVVEKIFATSAGHIKAIVYNLCLKGTPGEESTEVLLLQGRPWASSLTLKELQVQSALCGSCK